MGVERPPFPMNTRFLCIFVILSFLVGACMTDPQVSQSNPPSAVLAGSIKDHWGNERKIYKGIIDGRECLFLEGSNGHNITILAMSCDWSK